MYLLDKPRCVTGASEMVYYSLDVEILLQTSILPSKPSRWLSEYFSKDEMWPGFTLFRYRNSPGLLGSGKIIDSKNPLHYRFLNLIQLLSRERCVLYIQAAIHASGSDNVIPARLPQQFLPTKIILYTTQAQRLNKGLHNTRCSHKQFPNP